MTYVLAWKSDAEVFLAADSALTTRFDSVKLDLKKSSFGQPHVIEEGKKVEERALKLFLKEDIGIALAGRYDVAIRVIKSFYETLPNTSGPEEALNLALFFSGAPFSKSADIQLAIAYYDGGPKLISYNSQRDDKIRSDETIIHLGSAPELFKKLSENWLRDISPVTKNQPRLELPSILAALQSYGILSPRLMELGIGGAFCGLYVDKTGGSWQPDILFSENDKLVNTCIRRDCLVVNSPTIGESRCFLTYLPPQSENSLREQTSRAIEEAEVLRRRGEYEYVIFINTQKQNLTLIQMNGQKRHEILWLEPFQENGREGTKIHIFPMLKALLNRNDGGLITALYKKPSVTEIPPDKITIREVNPNP